jgi:hypothetical protein
VVPSKAARAAPRDAEGDPHVEQFRDRLNARLTQTESADKAAQGASTAEARRRANEAAERLNRRFRRVVCLWAIEFEASQ